MLLPTYRRNALEGIMMRRVLRFASMGAAAAMAMLADRDVSACGGCFAPPRESDSVVTDHKMILSISPTQTTLYDQIVYSGSPSSFAWVLPIHGDVTVGLSADIVFQALDQTTQTQVNQPPLNCPPPPNCGGGFFGSANTTAGGGTTYDPPSSVVVKSQEQVGPYETVQLHSTDPQALDNWLVSHGYAIPPDVAPIVAAYVDEKFDFLAMKLAPGQGVQAMRPVRVSTAGASPVLPLRMVTAGTGAVTGITLWVVGDGRWEPQNFPFFTIGDGELEWDWAANSSNYSTLRTQKEAALGGRGWEIESSLGVDEELIRNIVRYGTFYPRAAFYAPDAGADYVGVDASADGGPGETPDQVREDDLNTLFAGIVGPDARITRLRSDIARAALAADFVLQASQDQSELSSIHNVTREKGQPQCPLYGSCGGASAGLVVGQAPRDQARAAAATRPSGGCSTAVRTPIGERASAGAIASLIGLAATRARRRRSTR
jgi:uncharacterized protein DUF2330